MKNKVFSGRTRYYIYSISNATFFFFFILFLEAKAHAPLNERSKKLFAFSGYTDDEFSELSSANKGGRLLSTFFFRTFENDLNYSNAINTDDVSAPPVVNAGPDQSITLPLNSVTLSGSATDQDGSIASYNWIKVSGAEGVITTPASAITTVTGMVQGSYLFRLTATDNTGSSSSDDIIVTVNPSGNITTFSFINKPISDPEINNWGRGAVYWNGTAWDNSQAPTIPEGTSRGKNSFWRFAWSDLEDNNGNYVFYGSYPRLDHYVRQTIDRGEMLHFGGVMPICSACGGGPTATFFDGATMYYPKYIHDSMQKTSQSAWNTGTGLWMPNWNNPYYLERYEKLLLAVADYFNTGSYVAQSGPWAGKRVYYKDLLDAVGISGYGDFGEWHNWPYDGQIPSNAMATSQSLKRIIDANRTAFPNTQLITLMGSFYNGGSARVPTDVTYHVLTAKNNFGYIGWRRDNIGDRGYGDWLENNPNSFNGMRFDTAIRNRWKYAKVTGEPLNGDGSCCPYYSDVRRQVNLYHYSGFGNGNYGSRTQQVWDTIRNVMKLTGYRYNLNGGSMTSVLNPGQPFMISLNWRNVGVAPIYQKRWKVKYELKNASDQVVQSWISRLQMYLFLPASVDSVLSESFTLRSNIPTGNNYKLTLKLEDSIGLLEPIYLALNSPTRNADGSYTLQSNIAVQEGGINLPPVSNAGADKKIDLPFFAAELRGGGNDPENAQLSYQWSMIDGPSNVIIRSPGLPVTSVEGFIAGVYRFQLKVSDPLGAFGLDTVTYFINTPPKVTLGPDKELTLPDNIIQLAATSTDIDGAILSYSWNQVSGPSGAAIVSPNSSSTRIEGLTEGNYFFSVSVMDDDSATASDTIGIKVNKLPNRPPLAVAGADILLVLPNSNTQLNASSSTDTDGNIAQYEWTVLSGPLQYTFGDANASSTSFYDLVQGNYQVMLTVTDNDGATDTDTLLIKVDPDPNNIAPVANAGIDLDITLPLDSVELDGSGSSDPDGTIARYHWAFLQGPDRYLIVSSNSVKTVLKDLVFGRYIFLLTITDNRGSTSYDTVEVNVNADPTNKLPLANAGASAVITLPENKFQLDGSASGDPDGILIRFEWNQISGPNTALSGTTLSKKVLVSNLVKGVYRFSLLVMDNNGAIDQDTIQITVNQPPAADAGADILLQFPDNGTAIDASGSIDTDGSVISYRWEWLSGPAQYTMTDSDKIRASLGGLSIGTYRFKLLVTDDMGGVGTDTITIIVNGKPEAKAGPDIELTMPTNVAVLDGNGSNDADGSIKSYAWTYVSGPAAYKIINPVNPATIISDLTNGTYVFMLQVTDNYGAVSADSVTVIVNKAPNRLPVANAGINFSVFLPDPYIQLNGSGSYDPDGSISSYRWKLVSGPGAVAFSDTMASITIVTGVKAGSYTFQLTVQDNEGAVSTTQVTVTVNTPLNKLPVADAGKDTSIVIPYSRAVLNGGRSYDPDGTLVSYAWRQVSGPAGATLQDGTKALARAIDLVEGTYAFELTVKDNSGAVGKDTMRVNVLNLNRSDEVFRLYPNPAVQQIRVQCQIDAVSNGTISIFSQSGHVLLSQPFRSDPGLFQREINISTLKPGMYYMEMLIASQKRYVSKFIKQ